MALPSTGSISMSQVNVELKKSETQQISLNDSDVRKLAGKASGTISMGDLRGKKNTENVSGYTLFSGSWTGGEQQNKSFSFDLVIPKNIISGNIVVTFDVGSGGSYFPSKPTANIPNIANFQCRNSQERNQSKTKAVSNFLKQTIKCSGQTGTNYRTIGSSDNPTKRWYSTSVTVKITFTGEWEL